MALILIVIIMVIWVGIVGSLYSSITPFIYRLWSVSNYNVAYYGAMMWAERWLLSLRYHDAWFQWNSWIKTWNNSDDIRAGWYSFGKFTEDATSDAYRQVASRVQSIPAAGQGNVEGLFAGTWSKDYNMIDYREWLELPLYLDNTSNVNEFYTGGDSNIEPLAGGSAFALKWNFRLPPKIESGLGSTWLDIGQDIDDDTINDDVIVNWWLEWIDPGNNNESFSLFPSIKNDFSRWEPLYAYDNAIRESVINNGDVEDNIDTNVLGTPFSLVKGENSVWNLLAGNNILPLNSSYTGSTINDILTDAVKPYLTFAITNRMQTTDGNIYPFLERQIKACEIPITTCGDVTLPDRFFSLQWVWVVKDYTVRIFIKKPVRKTSNTANFTIIF